ncbi:sigma-70 family RNA polymerase sigma factor [bacterium]|nr:sigma-70 family RNA polymerase sigma factor [bacterium]
MTTVEQIWAGIEVPVVNTIKIDLMSRFSDQILLSYANRLEAIVKKYARHLPYHVADSEIDDLRTIARLELLETLKVWLPSRNLDFWPLAQARVIGAMKDHIRYISKSDPSRFYDWITDAAYVYMAVNDRADFQDTIDDGTQLAEAMQALTDRERSVVILHTKDDLTFKQIGEQFGISESQISRIYKKSLEKIKKQLSPKHAYRD